MRRTSTSILALLVAAAMTPAFAQEHAPKKTQATEAETVSENPQPPVKEKPGGMTNKDWWSSRLDLTALRQHESMSNPYGADYDLSLIHISEPTRPY